MPATVDVAAMALMESLGALSFIIAFLFIRQHRKIADRLRAFHEALKRQKVSDRADGKCFSSEWALDNIVYKPRRLLEGTPLLIVAIGLLLSVFYFVIGPRLFMNILNVGYSLIIAIIGIALLLWTDAFQAYNYTNAIYRVEIEQLDREDQSYLELAKEAMRKAYPRFISLGISFALVGPFIPQIFRAAIDIFALYASIYFGASEAALKSLSVIGTFVVLILPGLMLFFPEIIGRIIISKGKILFRKIFKPAVK